MTMKSKITMEMLFGLGLKKIAKTFLQQSFGMEQILTESFKKEFLQEIFLLNMQKAILQRYKVQVLFVL